MRSLLAAAVLAASLSPALAHTGEAPSPTPTPAAEKKPVEFKLEKLSDRAYCLYGQGGNVGILVTDAGVVVVDDQYEEVAQGVVDQIRKVTDRPIRYLVNTHYHGDHTGGNPVFVKFAEIIAHDTVRPRLLEYPEIVKKTFPDRKRRLQEEIDALKDATDPYRVSLEKDLGLLDFLLKDALDFDPAKAAPPGLTYESSLHLWLGGQEVEVLHVAPGHTDGDSMVYFASQKVLHMGDLFFNGTYPFIDVWGGGSAHGYVKNIERILTIVPADAKVIPGHGPSTDVATLRRFGSFMSDLVAAVEKAAKAGKSKAEAVRTITMDQYPEIKPQSRTLGNEISVAYDEVVPPR